MYPTRQSLLHICRQLPLHILRHFVVSRRMTPLGTIKCRFPSSSMFGHDVFTKILGLEYGCNGGCVRIDNDWGRDGEGNDGDVVTWIFRGVGDVVWY